MCSSDLGLRSGMFGRALFTFGTRQSLVIPSASISEQGQLQSVFAIEGGFAHKRLVTVGERHGDRVEVLSGLSAGESIVSPVPDGLSDGSNVEVRP